MTDKEKIRKEIERRKNEHAKSDHPFSVAQWEEDEEILSFIKSLPEEPTEPFKVEEGRQYKCIKDYVLASGEVIYKKGSVYTGTRSGLLRNERGGLMGSWEKSGSKYFQAVPATIQECIIGQICRCKKARDIQYECMDKIDELARNLLTELQKIEGWECMIKECNEHYAQYPDKFFGWCSVTHTENAIQFVKGYSDGDEYEVLEIDMRKSLEQQVKERKAEIESIEKEKETRKREKELKELKRLKEKYE